MVVEGECLQDALIPFEFPLPVIMGLHHHFTEPARDAP